MFSFLENPDLSENENQLLDIINLSGIDTENDKFLNLIYTSIIEKKKKIKKNISAVHLGLFILKLNFYEPGIVSMIYKIIINYFTDYVNDRIPGYYFEDKFLWKNVEFFQKYGRIEWYNLCKFQDELIIKPKENYYRLQWNTVSLTNLWENESIKNILPRFTPEEPLDTPWRRLKTVKYESKFVKEFSNKKIKNLVLEKNLTESESEIMILKLMDKLSIKKPKYDDCFLNKKKMKKNQNYIFRKRKM